MMRCLDCPPVARAPANIALLVLSVTMFCATTCTTCSTGSGNPPLLGAHAFVVPEGPRASTKTSRHRHDTRLFGLSEWRRSAGDPPAPSPRPLLLLPFTPADILPLGQSTTIVLKEGRYYDLFQDCIDDHQAVMGMVVMGDDGLGDALVLCDISDFDVDAGYRGKVTVTITLRAVGYATLLELTQMKPVMMGICLELVDDDEYGASSGDDGDGNESCVGRSASMSSTTTDDEWTLAEDLLGDIESILQTLGLESRYKDALDVAQRTLAEGSTMEDRVVDTTDSQARLRVSAASWAVFAACLPSSPSGTHVISSCLQEAISTTSALGRLKLGRKALLEMMYQGSDTSDASATEAGGDVMGFG
jgi:hypothetical protein